MDQEFAVNGRVFARVVFGELPFKGGIPVMPINNEFNRFKGAVFGVLAGMEEIICLGPGVDPALKVMMERGFSAADAAFIIWALCHERRQQNGN